MRAVTASPYSPKHWNCGGSTSGAFAALHLAGVIAVEGDADAVAKEFAYLADGRGDGALDFALAEIEREMPKVRSSWREWTQFARNWASLAATRSAFRSF